MYLYLYSIVLCLCVSGILSDLIKEEGNDCEWEGLAGKCVKETRCMTTLDEKSPKHPLCSNSGEESIICCTDCELVNDTRNAVISPTSGAVYWKNGGKARDSCLQYLKELPYQCKQSGFYGGISRILDEDKKCYNVEWPEEGAPTQDKEPILQYPHQVLVSYGEKDSVGLWFSGGVIISDRYILTAAHPFYKARDGEAKYVLLGTNNISDPSVSIQDLKVKRFIPYPEYRRSSSYHDIALIEMLEPIEFNDNVLPACLHVDVEVFVKEAVTTTWATLQAAFRETGAIDLEEMEELSEEECKVIGTPKFLKQGYDRNTQICYKSNQTDDVFRNCGGVPGQPVMVDTQFSSCVHTVIGTISFGPRTCEPETRKPNAYTTRVSYYVPWIESIVWP